jgi:hypothetical protein
MDALGRNPRRQRQENTRLRAGWGAPLSDAPAVCSLVLDSLIDGDELGLELEAGRRGFHHLLHQLFEFRFSEFGGIG